MPDGVLEAFVELLDHGLERPPIGGYTWWYRWSLHSGKSEGYFNDVAFSDQTAVCSWPLLPKRWVFVIQLLKQLVHGPAPGVPLQPLCQF